MDLEEYLNEYDSYVEKFNHSWYELPNEVFVLDSLGENEEMSESEKDQKIKTALSDIESMSGALDALEELLQEKPGDYDIEIKEYCYELRTLATEISKSLTDFQE